MSDTYAGREQTQAKHFILKRYLQALAFKVLNFADLTYIDGFSGPWEAKTVDFSDTSFMIAIGVLQDAQQQIYQRTNKRRRIRCFFSEVGEEAYNKLVAAVAKYHRPDLGFEVQTFHGRFEDAVDQIQRFIGESFPLFFIDPTGWKGYPFEKIKPLFRRAKCEVLINFMYEFINRFSNSDAPEIITSLDPILGGPGWRGRLNSVLPRGPAVEQLFRETLQSAGAFPFVISTKIDKSTAERPHFVIAYATKSAQGLKAFRETEYKALREHEKNRANAMAKKREAHTGARDMFAEFDATVRESSIDEIVKQQKLLAATELQATLVSRGPQKFETLVCDLLQAYMLRETNVKDICVDLHLEGTLENTWGSGGRKPRAGDTIRLK